MGGDQLPLFQRKTYKGIIPSIAIEVRLPAGEMTVLQTLPAYYNHLKDGEYSQYTPDNFTGDVKKFGVYLKDGAIKEITQKDIQGWISFLKTTVPKGEGLSVKTVSRKLTALGNYFNWLKIIGVVAENANPMRDIANSRITSPLPEILFEEECKRIPRLQQAWIRGRTCCLPFFWKPGSNLRSFLTFGYRISIFQISVVRRCT